LAQLISASLTGSGLPTAPSAPFFRGPLGDVEIERPDAYQLVLGIDPRAGDDGLLPVRAVTLRLMTSRNSFQARRRPAAAPAW